jgi:Cu/Ag efflux protein CusF
VPLRRNFNVSYLDGILVLSAVFVSSAEVRAQGMQQKGMDRMPGMGDAKQVTSASATGTVTAINAADRKISFNHGPIPEIKWPAMKMEFPVVPSVDLSTGESGR